jgi:hypothetical protein
MARRSVSSLPMPLRRAAVPNVSPERSSAVAASRRTEAT